MSNLKDSFTASPDIPFLLLPFEYHKKEEIKRVLSFFGPALLLIPWQVEAKTMEEVTNHIKIIHPPEDMDPGPGFKTILREYKTWMNTHNDRAMAGFLRFWNNNAVEERESIWDIKRMILGKELNIRRPPSDDLPLKWHLLLHLAMEMSRNIYELEDTMEKLKNKDLLLKGAVDDDKELMGILRDVPIRAPDTLMPAEQLRRVIDACKGLFSQDMNQAKIFFIKDKRLINLILDELSDYLLDSKQSAEQIRFKWPDLSHLSYDQIKEIKDRLFQNEILKEFRKRIFNLDTRNIESIKEMSHKLLNAIPENLREGTVEFTLTYIPPINSSKHDPLLIFQNKSLCGTSLNN